MDVAEFAREESAVLFVPIPYAQTFRSRGVQISA